MNYKIIIAGCLLFIGACRAEYRPKYNTLRPQGAPFVRLKNGQEMTGAEVKTRHPFIGREKIQINGQEYLSKDVAEYQDAKGRYVNVGHNQFAWQAVNGTIDVYRNEQTKVVTNTSVSKTGMMHTSTHTHIVRTDYIRSGDSSQLQLLNFKNLRAAMVNPGNSVTADINEYLRIRRLNHTLRIVGWSATVVGVGLMFAGVFNDNDGMFYPGLVLAAGGPVVLTVNLGIQAKNSRRVYTMLDKYNRGR